MNAKEMILKCLPKDKALCNCKYGKINKTTAFEIGESSWYIFGEKTVRVTIVKSVEEKIKSDDTLTKTFFGNGTEKNKSLASEYIKGLKDNTVKM